MKTIFHALLLFSAGSLLFACNSTPSMPWAQTATFTMAPPTASSTPTVTVIPSATPTPVYTLLAKELTELRDAPNKNSNIIGHPAEGTVLVVFEELGWMGLWYHVRVQGTNQEGWVSEYLVDPQFDIYGDISIPIQLTIPITATPLKPTVTPALERTVTITIINELDQELEVGLDGPYQLDFKIPAHKRKTIQIPAGSYYTSLSAPGYTSRRNLVTWAEGFKDTWDVTFK